MLPTIDRQSYSNVARFIAFMGYDNIYIYIIIIPLRKFIKEIFNQQENKSIWLVVARDVINDTSDNFYDEFSWILAACLMIFYLVITAITLSLNVRSYQQLNNKFYIKM